MADTINGVPIGDLPGIESVPDDSLLVVEFLGKAYRMPGAVLRQLFQDILDAMGSSVDDVTEARLTAAIETVLASGKYNGVSPIVEVTKQEDETFVLHVVDAFGIKDYPIKVKLPDLSVNGSNVMVELSGDDTKGYTVLLDGEAVTGDTLDKMAKEGANIIGVAATFGVGFTMPNGYPGGVSSGTIFQYGNAVASRAPGTFENTPGHSFEFHVRVEDVDYGLFYEDGQWKGIAISGFLTLLLTEKDGEPCISLNNQIVGSWYLSEILNYAAITYRPVFCYQKDMRFYTKDGTAIIPFQNAPFEFALTDKGVTFTCEQDGYKYSLTVAAFVEYEPTAEKTVAYKTAESKGDDLEEEDGNLFLLSAGERIGSPVPLGAGPQGPPGESGVTTPVNGFFTLSVDSDGNLWAHSAEGGTTPDFEYDSETGNFYFITEE